MLESTQRLGLETQLGHVEHEVVFVEQPQNDLLAKDRREHGDAEVEILDLAADARLDLDAAILGQSLLRDVELGHDLETAGDGLLESQEAGASSRRAEPSTR